MDVREIISNKRENRTLPENHIIDFERKLDRTFHQKSILKPIMIAATIVIIFSLGLFNFSSTTEMKPPQENSEFVSVGDFSPELKKIENYYITAINYQLANLNIDEEGKEILSKYLMKLSELTQSYKHLSQKLQKDEIDEDLINALIDNLQMRLTLMEELKNELKKIKSNESISA
jgi:predicted RNase H-like nuclease (RuvC/YqgF family)